MNFAKVARVGFAVIFWSWNAMFLLLVTAGFAPMVMIDLVADATQGLALWSTVFWAALLFFLPVAVVAAAVLRLRTDPAALFVAFFGIEVPGISLACVRLFGLADLHGAAGLTLASVVVGGVALLAWLARPPSTSPLARALIHAGLAAFAIGSAYLGLVLAFITLPALAGASIAVLEATLREPGIVIAAVVPALWAGLTVMSVFLSPVFTPIAAVRALVQSHRAVAAALGARGALLLGVVPAALLVVVIASGWRQPAGDVLARLAQPPTSDAQRRAIVEDEDSIRAGLVDAYLARHRYPADETTDTLRTSFRRFGAAPDALADFHRALARPFVFDGNASSASGEADRLHRAVFGEEIERSARDDVRQALASNALREERYAGFMNEGEERVWLAAQTVTVEDKGGWAIVEIADTWMNQTANPEEVLLSFSLPPDAAVTGLWLGSDPDKAKAFTHVVAPRGAAQQVYNEQVRQRRDPALLEQVGPQQYRLRVFPVPPRERKHGRFMNAYEGWHDLAATRPRMHVWLRYEALANADGTVPFPALAERRNGFWDDATHRTAVVGHGEVKPEHRDDDADRWVQTRPIALSVKPMLRARAGKACATLESAAPLAVASLTGQQLDVVIDRSFEMKHRRAELAEAKRALEATGATLRFVLTSGAFRGEAPSRVDALDVDALVPFASTSPREMLTQWARLPQAVDQGTASAVVVLAGRGSFDVAVDGPLEVPLDVPLFLVHIGGLPAGYDDATADAIAKSGGTAVDARDLDDVIRAVASHGAPDAPLVVAGKRFTLAPKDDGACTGGPPGVIARLAVRSLDRTRRADDPLALDALHRIAVGAGVVTPYSSMIVLVDEEQRRRLAALEKREDRFDREVEAHKEATPSVTGVPEPHEWALLLVVGAAVLVLVRRTRTRRSSLA